MRAGAAAPSRMESLEGDAPLQAELLNAEQMEERGRELAGEHQAAHLAARPQILCCSGWRKRRSVIRESCKRAGRGDQGQPEPRHAGRRVAARQLLPDRRADPHGPAASAASATAGELPRLASGPSARLPRVYDIALEAISHGDGRFDRGIAAPLRRAPTRRVTPLTLGELWAIPIMLRLALIENLRRVAARVAPTGIDRNVADALGRRDDRGRASAIRRA